MADTTIEASVDRALGRQYRRTACAALAARVRIGADESGGVAVAQYRLRVDILPGVALVALREVALVDVDLWMCVISGDL